VPQLHPYVPDDVAAALRARARERGTSVSKLLAEIGYGLDLVSDDRAAFARVPDLSVTSWRDA